MQKLVEERMKKLASMKTLKGPYSFRISDVKTGSWRYEHPVIDPDTCVKCGICIEHCPCGVVDKFDIDGVERVQIDYVYCKGCGICAEECPKKAIRFVSDAEFRKEARD